MGQQEESWAASMVKRPASEEEQTDRYKEQTDGSQGEGLGD